MVNNGMVNNGMVNIRIIVGEYIRIFIFIELIPD